MKVLDFLWLRSNCISQGPRPACPGANDFGQRVSVDGGAVSKHLGKGATRLSCRLVRTDREHS